MRNSFFEKNDGIFAFLEKISGKNKRKHASAANLSANRRNE